jgi:hypothetical protein
MRRRNFIKLIARLAPDEAFGVEAKRSHCCAAESRINEPK